MGWAEKRGSTWRYRYQVGAQTLSRAGFATKAEAQRWGRAIEADQARDVFVDPRGGDTPLAEWCRVWLGSRSGLKARTAGTDEGRVRLHITPRLGALPLREISPIVVGGWLRRLETDLSPKTVRNCHGLLYAILQAAVEERLLTENPCRLSRLPELPEAEMRFLTPPEYGRLVTVTAPHYRPLIVTLGGTGMRWGETVGLKVRHCDVLGGVIRVAESLHEDDRGGLAWGTPKSRRSRRVVSINAAVQDALVPLVAGKGGDEPVFTTTRGALVRRSNFRRVWVDAITAAGLPGLRVHDLRHSHCAWLIAAGVPLPAISRRLGHASITVTIDRYGHLLPEIDVALLAALDDALPRSTPVSLPLTQESAPPGASVEAQEGR